MEIAVATDHFQQFNYIFNQENLNIHVLVMEVVVVTCNISFMWFDINSNNAVSIVKNWPVFDVVNIISSNYSEVAMAPKIMDIV